MYAEHKNTPRSIQNHDMRAGLVDEPNTGGRGLLGALARHGCDPRTTQPCDPSVGVSIELERLSRAAMDADSQESVGSQTVAEHEGRRPRQVQNSDVAAAESVEGGRIYHAMADADIKSGSRRLRKIHNRTMTAAELIQARTGHCVSAAADITGGEQFGAALEHRGGRPPKLQNRKMTVAELFKERMVYFSATGLDNTSSMDNSRTGEDRGQHPPVLQCIPVMAVEPIEQEQFPRAKINVHGTGSAVMTTCFDSVLGVESMRSPDGMGSSSVFDDPRGYQLEHSRRVTRISGGQTMKDERGGARAPTQMPCWRDGKPFRATPEIEAIRLSRWLRFSDMATGSEHSQIHSVISL